MKGSTALIRLSLLCSLLAGSLWAVETTVVPEAGASLEGYLSELKRKEFSLDYEKVDEESIKLRDSWIQPVQLKYSYSTSNPYSIEQTQENAAITIDQPIFQTGGIYYGIKFAEASRRFSNYSIDRQKRLLIKQAAQLLMQIKQSELTIARQELQIANARINLEQKREQYLGGQLDSGFLNSAIIEKNRVTQAFYDLQTNQERLVSSFESISDLDYREAAVPKLTLLNEKQFLDNNIDLDIARSESLRNRYNKNVTLAKYLPKVSLTAGYSWQKQEKQSFGGNEIAVSDPETDYYNYGFKVTVPLDINSFNDVEATRVGYMKSLIRIDDTQRQLKTLYEQVNQNLENFDKKIALAEENLALYQTLLAETEELYKAGYKTAYDVDTLKNSQQIEQINIKILQIDRQLELLNLYEKLADDV